MTIQISTDAGFEAIKALEQKKLVKIIGEIDYSSPALPGSPLSLKAFKDWITEREKSPTVSLKEAEKEWAELKKQIRKLMR